MDARNYSAEELLENGRRIKIRSLQHTDRDAVVAALENASDQLIYRRFFGARRHFTEREILNFVDVDFERHVAVVAVTDEGGQSKIVGSGRYIVVNSGKAEVAFTVLDHYQGQGIGTILFRHICILAREADLNVLVAEVLPENAAMLNVFKNSGYPTSVTRDRGVMRIDLQLR